MALRDWYCEDVLSGNQEVKRVYEDEQVLAFHHPRPTSDIHVVVVPKEHVPSLLDSKALDGALLTSMVRAIQHTAIDLASTKSGFQLWPTLPHPESRLTCIGTS